MSEDNGARSAKARSSSTQGSAWAMNLGSVSGIPIRVHFTFFLLLAWVAFVMSGASRWLGVLYIVGIFACVVLHELGHSIVAQRYGIRVAEIVLYPIGGVARMERLPAPAQELWIALAGPAVNLVIAGILAAILALTGGLAPLGDLQMGGGHWWEEILVANVFLFLFNMIPAFPMDGGRVLRALLGLKLGEVRATEIASTIGQMLAIALGFWGLTWGHNPLLLFIAFFVFIGAGQEASMYRGKALVEGLPVRAAMVTDFRTLPVGATLQQAFDLLLQTSQQDFPVVNGEEVVGVLSRRALLQGFQTEGPEAFVAGAMDREFPVAPPEMSLEEIAAEMQSGESPYVLVMEDDRLQGIVTTENLAELLVLRQLQERTHRA